MSFKIWICGDGLDEFYEDVPTEECDDLEPERYEMPDYDELFHD